MTNPTQPLVLNYPTEVVNRVADALTKAGDTKHVMLSVADVRMLLAERNYLIEDRAIHGQEQPDVELLAKPHPTRDLYIGWSVRDSRPCGAWTRAQALDAGFLPSQLERADQEGRANFGPCRGDVLAGDQVWLRRPDGTYMIIAKGLVVEYALLLHNGYVDEAVALLTTAHRTGGQV